MQKKQGVIKGLLFGVFGIIGFSSFTFAQGNGAVAKPDTSCLTTEQNKCYVQYTADQTSEINQCILNAATNCAQQQATSATNCLSICGNDGVCLSACSACPSGTTYDNTIKTCSNTLGTVDITGKTTCKSNCYSACNLQYQPGRNTATVNNTGNQTCKNTCDTTCTPDDNTVMGITIGPKCLKNGQCGLNIYDMLGIHKSTSATLFIQDILLSATLFIGTIITVALIYSGIMYIMAGVNGKDPSKAKNGITYSIIGLLLVISSYTIIRLVQYIAKGL